MIFASKGTDVTEKTETKQIVQELTQAYWMEMETVQNYLANSVNLVGVRAEEIKKSLADDVAEELSHAQQLAKRIHVIGGQVPGSEHFKAAQSSLQPPEDPTNLVSVIRGVIEAEENAIAQYNKLIQLCDGVDYPTQDLCITLLADEESHRREFIGFLTEFEK
ncbi:MAG: ferritin-like domain-containing protein [Phycisphaeraceae bacterium]